MAVTVSARCARLFLDLGDVEVAVEDEREGARDGRRGHDQNVRAVALAAERGALRHAEPLLLVAHGEREVGRLHVRLQQRVRGRRRS